MSTSKQVSGEQRDRLIDELIHIAILRADMCRHSGAPETGLLIMRSAYPLLLRRLHRVTVGESHKKSADVMLESLKCEGILTEDEHIAFRRATAGLSEYASGRDLRHTIQACERMAELIAAAVPAEVLKMRQQATEKPSRLRQWATAAGALFAFGS